MQLSENTISVLKNFSSINPNLVFRQGNQVKTISVAKNILATATIAETIPKEFGVYDLNEFLSVIGLFEDPNLSFGDSSVKITDGRQSVNYWFSALENLTTPSKDITMPKCEIEFTLTEVDLNKLRKAAATLGVSEVMVCGDEGGDDLTVKVSDTKNSTSNTFQLNISGDVRRPSSTFQMVFNIGNFKFASGDYRVGLSSKLISNFKNTSTQIEYWVALEKSSVFNA
jgi:gp45 sliding clamp, C terminal